MKGLQYPAFLDVRRHMYYNKGEKTDRVKGCIEGMTKPHITIILEVGSRQNERNPHISNGYQIYIK